MIIVCGRGTAAYSEIGSRTVKTTRGKVGSSDAMASVASRPSRVLYGPVWSNQDGKEWDEWGGRDGDEVWSGLQDQVAVDVVSGPLNISRRQCECHSANITAHLHGAIHVAAASRDQDSRIAIRTGTKSRFHCSMRVSPLFNLTSREALNCLVAMP